MAAIPPRPATIRDVARAAGVSVGTVSRSLNAPETVRAKTLERVRAAIVALGFKPDPRAQSMRRRNTLAVGIIIDDISNPVHAAIFTAAEAVLRDRGFFVRLVNTSGKARREAEAMDELQHGHVDGLIVTIDDEGDPGCLERLRGLRVPCVLLDRAADVPLDSVATDHAAGMQQAVDYLHELGHRRIGLVTFGTEMHPGRDRLRGFRQAFADKGLPCPLDLISAHALAAGGSRSAAATAEPPDGARRRGQPDPRRRPERDPAGRIERARRSLARDLRPDRARRGLSRSDHGHRPRPGRARPDRRPFAAGAHRRARRQAAAARHAAHEPDPGPFLRGARPPPDRRPPGLTSPVQDSLARQRHPLGRRRASAVAPSAGK